MALSNRDRLDKALEQLRNALAPYVVNRMEASLGADWQQRIPPDRNLSDVHTLLKLMVDHWQGVFKAELGFIERSYAGELLSARNDWAHQKPFNSDDTDRILDTAQRLCRAISATEPADAIRSLREELQQQVFAERARNKVRYQSKIEGMPLASLKPWREVMTPHRDVASGRYAQAEFAADLDQVHRGLGSDEYRDPIEFYNRTFITSGLEELLRIALNRLNGLGGDPVLELQTNFGGGKTHAMLALFHLCSGTDLARLPGLEAICSQTGITTLPACRRSVLVGTAHNPAQPKTKPDGTVVHTLWGELAWQLGGTAAYARVATNDQQAISPGAQLLAELLQAQSPCLILIDEWVAYARQLVNREGLSGGTFDAQVSFAQALTEAVKQVPTALLLVSVPQSGIELGGDNGRYALQALKNVVTRVAYQWRPADRKEGFEIVRRRLFEPITTTEQGAYRDAVVREFTDLYRNNPSEFPAETREAAYRDKLRNAYPIHPELFERLYDDWSTLDKFQRTRGVLRLLAQTIHQLWESDSKDLMIMPSSLPMDDGSVKNELLRYLDDNWEPIVSQDVDGPDSLPLQLDRENPNFGRVSACRRVARALYVGTAPNAGQENPGIGDQRVKLACVLPGEPIPSFGDALRRLGDRARYVQQDGDRYWIDTRPNLNRTAEEYKESHLRQPEELWAEISQALSCPGDRGSFAGVHACPLSNADVPDEPVTRLVLLAPQFSHQRVSHQRGQSQSPARQFSETCLRQKGNSPRQYANTLVFLAPDETGLKSLMDAVAQRRAWQRILNAQIDLNLTVGQVRLAEQRVKEATEAINLRLPEAWVHLLVPFQQQPGPDGADWEECRLSSGRGSLAQRVAQKLEQEEWLYPVLGTQRLRQLLDRWLWPNTNAVQVSDLLDWFRKYLYLPRLVDDQVVLRALTDGRASLSGKETFYLASNYDPEGDRYDQLTPQANANPPTNQTWVVKPTVAQAQLAAEAATPPNAGGVNYPTGQTFSPVAGASPDDYGSGSGTAPPTSPHPPKPARPKVFRGSVDLDPVQLGLSASQIAETVLQHLTTLPGAQVEVRLEMTVTIPDGIDEATARAATEDANTLRFRHVSLDQD
jgi:predicted AAA+ superfamily ATPase